VLSEGRRLDDERPMAKDDRATVIMVNRLITFVTRSAFGLQEKNLS
jgi:hypothetical protein